MFKRKGKSEPGEENPEKPVQVKNGLNWFKISMIANAAIILGIAASMGGMAVIHQSDTNPAFCGTCHNMQKQVTSYLDSNHMDNVHAKAGVQCKDCHDYPIAAEITSGIKFVTGNYDKDMPRRKFADEMCMQCHISNEYLADQTDFLVRNPHMSHWPDLKCRSCHISHDEQVDYCSECHDNGSQRLTGGSIVPRAVNPWAEGGEPPAGSH